MDQGRRSKRKARIRRKIYGTQDFPRLTVYKSLKSIYVQVVDDDQSKTLCGAIIKSKNKVGAQELAKVIVDKMKSQKIERVKFDRNGYVYHGVIKEFADGVRAGSIVL